MQTQMNMRLPRQRNLLLVFMFFLALLPGWGNAQAANLAAPDAVHTAALPSLGDAYVLASQPATTYGAGPLGVIPTSQAYMIFDITGLPTAATIVNARLKLMPADIIGTGSSTVNVNRVDAAWDEATVTYASKPTMSATGSTVVSTYTLVEWDVTATVQQWHSGAAVNNGFGLTTGDPGVYFHSKESGPAPTLVITFTIPDRPEDPVNPGRLPHPDLGDAPDSTNHHGMANVAYPVAGVNGNFPTVWEDPGNPSGPKHLNETPEGWLGLHVSREREADGGPDQDIVNNIINTPAGALNVSNLDRGDDGWLNRTVTFPNCQPTKLEVRVSRAMTSTLNQMYLNIWFDGNRDGDWADMNPCPAPNDPNQQVRSFEWIVQNFVVNLGAIPAGGHQDLVLNTVLVMNTTPGDPHWLRFMLSESPAVRPLVGGPADGRGPQHPNAYKYGETEDYPQRPAPQGEPGELHLEKRVQTNTDVVRPGDIVSFTIGLAHVGGTAPAAAMISDTLPAGLILDSQVHVREEAPQVEPLLALVHENKIGWRGLISPGGKLIIAFRARVARCFGPDREINNVAVAQRLNGPKVEANAAIKVDCSPIVADNILVQRFLTYTRPDGDPAPLQENDPVQAALVTAELPAGYIPGVPTFVRTVLRNLGAEPVALSLNFEKIEWSFVADDEPDQGASTNASAATPMTGTLGSGDYRQILLNPGESKAVDIAVTPPPLNEDEHLEQMLQGVSVLNYCLSDRDHRGCPDLGQIRKAILRFRLHHSDLGDAPDSTNHFTKTMEAYPGVPGQFPTVHSPVGGGLPGPLHRNARPFHLGQGVSFELEADLGPDQDFINNLAPLLDVKNRDRFDDGIRPDLVKFEHCQATRIPVQVFISPAMKAFLLAAGHKGYMNMWVDSNRNGHGGDLYRCPATDQTPERHALEHIVINFAVDPALLVPGVNTIIVPTRLVFWPDELKEKPAWMRVTLTAAPIDLPLVDGDEKYSDGRGRTYRFGETEDYLLRGVQETQGADVTVRKEGRVYQEFNPENNSVISKVAWAIQYHNIGDQPAQRVVLRDALDKDLDMNAALLEVRSSPEIPYTVVGKSLVFDAGNLAPGAGGKIAILMATRQMTLTSNVITNTVAISATNDANPENNQASARVKIGLRPPHILTPLDGSTCRNEVNVMGRAQANALVDLYVDDALATTVSADAQGHWTHTLHLENGDHTLYAVARIGSSSSEASQTVTVIVDNTLLWNPMSLKFTDPRGHIRHPVDENGRLDAEGWGLNLRPNTTYTVSVGICCHDGNAQVTLAVAGVGEIDLTDPDGDGIYTATFKTGPRNETPAAMSLTIICGDQQVTASGEVVLIDPEGIVFDVISGSLLASANVACLEASATAAEESSASAFTLWNAGDFGQVNPQSTLADGYFSFLTPAGTYRIEVNRSGYQAHRSPDLAVVSDPVRYDVPLTPVISEAATQKINISSLGFEPTVLTVQPGAIIEWTNVDVSGHTASAESAANAAMLNARGIVFDSGLLNAGESYKFRLSQEGAYSYFDRTNPANSATIIVSSSAQPQGNVLFLPLMRK